jgi:hypothetical protein
LNKVHEILEQLYRLRQIEKEKTKARVRAMERWLQRVPDGCFTAEEEDLYLGRLKDGPQTEVKVANVPRRDASTAKVLFPESKGPVSDEVLGLLLNFHDFL